MIGWKNNLKEKKILKFKYGKNKNLGIFSQCVSVFFLKAAPWNAF